MFHGIIFILCEFFPIEVLFYFKKKVCSQETNFKEWKQVVQEIVRFVNVDKPLPNARPLRYCAMFDTHPDSLPYVARFHAKKVLKLKDAVLTSYHRNEVSAIFMWSCVDFDDHLCRTLKQSF